MSIQDDYFDIQHVLKDNPQAIKTFEHFARWAFDLEEENDQLIKKIQEVETTIKTMMGLKPINP